MNLKDGKQKKVEGLLPKEDVLNSLIVALNLDSSYTTWQEQLFNTDLETLDYLKTCGRIACVCDGDLSRVCYIWDM